MRKNLIIENRSKTKNTNTQSLPIAIYALVIAILSLIVTFEAKAHCDSFDGPLLKDAQDALKTNNVELVLKWINEEQEQEIVDLFKKTYNLKDGDQQVYNIVKKHFFETLVRLHRETEGAPYTGLKPAGSTKKIIIMSDRAIEDGEINELISSLNKHTASVIQAKYDLMMQLHRQKEQSVSKGREYVAAYVDYTHTIEGLHDILEHSGSENGSCEH